MTRVLESVPATSNSDNGPLLSSHLARLRQNGIRHSINGSEVASASGRTFENRSPIDNSVIAQVARGDESDVDRAAQAAKRAFKDWRNLNPDKRQALLHAQEEIFGPVLTVIPFRTEADALAIANSVRYGLTGYVWTNDLGRALRVADELEAGMIWLNSDNVRHLPAPFGGLKASGIGRDGGDYSFDFYMETKNVCLAKGTHKIPRLGA